MSIDKPCDIRPEVASELSAREYEGWGRALGRQLPPAAKFVVGGDIRKTTQPLLAALVEGLCQQGLDVVELGLLPTPMVYYAQHRLQADGCAIVTPSHHHGGTGGLTWMLHDRPTTLEEVAALQQAISLSPRPLGEGQGEGASAGRLQRGRGEGNGKDRPATEPRTLDISFDYVAGLQETFVESLTAQLHVVIDPMHGCWAGKARRYLQAVFPHCLFSTVHDVVDNRFDDRAADGFRTDELHELGEAVYRERAHLGLAFDADGDRLALVDNEGVVLSPEEAVCSLLACLGDELRGKPFVYDLRYSDRIAKAARQIGAKPLMERGGETFVRARMGETVAAFGTEFNGQYFYGALQGRDDPLYTACRLIAHLARSGQTLAALRRGCGPVYMTPELRVPVAAEEQPAIIQQVRAAWAEFPQLALDGVRIDIPGGWALVRSAVAEPALTFRFEGLDWHALENLVRRFCDTLPEHGEQLWSCYRAAMGGQES